MNEWAPQSERHRLPTQRERGARAGGGGGSRHGDDDNPGHAQMVFLFSPMYAGLLRDVDKYKQNNVWLIFSVCLAESRKTWRNGGLKIKRKWEVLYGKTKVRRRILKNF